MSAPTDKKQEFIELRAKGASFDKISQQIDISKPTLIKWSDELEHELQNYKAIEQEALRDEYLATKRHRIMVQGQQLKAVREELNKRDLSDVPTSKLIELCVKLSNSLAEGDRAITLSAEGLEMLDYRHQWTA